MGVLERLAPSMTLEQSRTGSWAKKLIMFLSLAVKEYSGGSMIPLGFSVQYREKGGPVSSGEKFRIDMVNHHFEVFAGEGVFGVAPVRAKAFAAWTSL